MYTVTVGNIGTVYSGTDYAKACNSFYDYVDASVNGCGRASGENVYLMKDGEVVDSKEYAI